MILYNAGARKNFKTIAKEYYDLLNQKHKGKYKPGSIIYRLETVLNDPSVDAKYKSFFRLFKSGNYKLLKKVLVGDPHQLSEIIKKMNSFAKRKRLEFYTGDIGNAASSEFGDKIGYVFNYTAFRKSDVCSWMISEVDIPVCPYCNQMPTSKVTHQGEAKLLFSIDHYFSQVFHPYLALSFYNLVPSCYGCNSTYKGTKVFEILTHIHPYCDDFNQIIKFTINRPVYNANDTTFKILMKEVVPADSVNNTKAFKSILDLGLEGRYEELQPLVLRIRYLKDLYPQSRIEELASFRIHNQRLLTTSSEIISYQCELPLDNNDIRNHVNGKIKRDMAKEFDLI